MQKVLDLAILGVNARNDSLEIGETFDERRELFLECRVVHQVLHGVHSVVNVSVYEVVACERTIPRIDVLGFAKRHAKPYPEQAFPFRIIVGTAHLVTAKSRT